MLFPRFYFHTNANIQGGTQLLLDRVCFFIKFDVDYENCPHFLESRFETPFFSKNTFLTNSDVFVIYIKFTTQLINSWFKWCSSPMPIGVGDLADSIKVMNMIIIFDISVKFFIETFQHSFRHELSTALYKEFNMKKTDETLKQLWVN